MAKAAALSVHHRSTAAEVCVCRDRRGGNVSRPVGVPVGIGGERLVNESFISRRKVIRTREHSCHVGYSTNIPIRKVLVKGFSISKHIKHI